MRCPPLTNAIILCLVFTQFFLLLLGLSISEPPGKTRTGGRFTCLRPSRITSKLYGSCEGKSQAARPQPAKIRPDDSHCLHGASPGLVGRSQQDGNQSAWPPILVSCCPQAGLVRGCAGGKCWTRKGDLFPSLQQLSGHNRRQDLILHPNREDGASCRKINTKTNTNYF
jgi:hypothetical protein